MIQSMSQLISKRVWRLEKYTYMNLNQDRTTFLLMMQALLHNEYLLEKNCKKRMIFMGLSARLQYEEIGGQDSILIWVMSAKKAA